MKSKTYHNTNNWSAPQSLSTFGIPIQNNESKKFLGLEEFNFSKKVTSIQFENSFLAYVPSFSTKIRPYIDELELFYSPGHNLTFHYATLFGVRQINGTDEVIQIRKLLENENFLNWVENNRDFQNNYGMLFNEAYKVYKQNYYSNNIHADGHSNRFIFNALYKNVFFHAPEIFSNWSNLKRASTLYN
jgi:hypothetical protein